MDVGRKIRGACGVVRGCVQRWVGGSIRAKLAAAVAMPLVMLGAFGAAEVSGTAQRADEVRRETDLARAVIGPAGLITTLQNERTWLSVELIGAQEQVSVPVIGYAETRTQTDEAIDAFRRSAEGWDDVVAEAFAPALDGLVQLEGLRAEVDAYPGPRQAVGGAIAFSNELFDRYSALVEPFFDAATDVSLAVVGDDQLRQGTELAVASARVAESLSLLLSATTSSGLLTPGGLDTPAEITEVSRLRADYDADVAAARRARGPYRALADELFPDEMDVTVRRGVDAALATGQPDLGLLLVDGSLVPFQEALREAIADRADALDARAASETRRVVLGLSVVAVIVVVSTWLVSRSISVPLRRLTSEARAVAERHLPLAVREVLDAPLGADVALPPRPTVHASGSSEVSEVADALLSAHDAALALAVEQAVLRRNMADSFVSLARRNQNLLARQLDFITELEAREVDGQGLSALFHLDHLATRMRRNAESLLVLAGVEPPRLRAEPVPMLDLLRAALGEVEDYRRVSIEDVVPVSVAGAAAIDLTHIVAEMMENALQFSPPTTQVVIRGFPSTHASYAVLVIDRGHGMADVELARANARLATTRASAVAPSRYLGHHVAGMLAARHGIAVELVANAGPGLTGVVQLPAQLVQPPTTARAVRAPLTT